MSSNEQINWKVIADELKEGDLIPVVGPELLWSMENGVIVNYRLWLATELARELNISSDRLEDILHPVEEVMLRFFKQGNIRSIRPYQVVKVLIQEREFPIPDSLNKLAQIKNFRFFLTTMYEPYLEMAVKKAWGMDDSHIRILENNLTKQPDDLTHFNQRSATTQFDPRYIENLYNNYAPPSIYYLYGRPSRMKSYALSEDDVLEANLMLHSSIYRPDELINFLSSKRMLILGCNFPNWLARFFIALTSPDPKKPTIQPVFVISDTVCRIDQNLAGYLKRLDAQVVQDATVESIIDKLYDLWTCMVSQPDNNAMTDNIFGRGSIFISYASEDCVVANQLNEEIRSIGLPVWLDKKELRPGDEWASDVESNLRKCSIFIPVISSASCSADDSRYFRKEWKLAMELKSTLNSEFQILPIQIGPIFGHREEIPHELSKLHWIDAPEGKIPDEGLSRINAAFRKSNSP